MTATFVIADRMPGLNEFIKAHDKDYHKGNQMKQRETDRAAWSAKAAHVPRFDRPVTVHFLWVEPNRKRDVDNVAFAKKFILDGLVRASVIVTGVQTCALPIWHVTGFSDRFAIDKERPRIEVTIVEAEA